jgi:hypothetical protein
MTFQGCWIYRMDNGDVGVQAVRPVIVENKCIMDGAKLSLRNNQTIRLCDDEMTVLAIYGIEFDE